MKKILLSILTIALVSIVAVGATRAYFFDIETSEDNAYVAGTLDLKVDDADSPVVPLSYSDIAPGFNPGYRIYCLKNSGTVTGNVSVEFSTVTNNENGVNEPETVAETESYASVDGELGQYLKRTVGWGPCNWTVPSIVISDWSTGPAHPWGVPGLNGTAGQTFSYSTTLAAGQQIGFFLNLQLENDLRRWDGTAWHDVDDNIIQSDSVDFDITFHLDQTP